MSGNKMPWLSKAKSYGESLETRYEIYHASNGTVNFAVNDGTTQSSVQTSDSNFVTGEWVMVSDVRDNENQKLKIYANDKLVAEDEDLTRDLTQTANLYFGTNIKITDYFEGDLDEINIFNYALGSTGIKELYINTAAIDDDMTHFPFEFKINSYPNPFNAITTFSYSIPNTSMVNLSLYNIIGQKIVVLINENKSAGHYTFSFDASHLSSGLYFYCLKAVNKIKIGKMILVK
ncbi:MAG: T9SS type A sorting domain-containing protein [Calditrichaceae bacterium]